MTGLEKVPSTDDVRKVYDILLAEKISGSIDLPEEMLALWTQWSRFDPRLAEILVEFFALNWEKIAPIALRKRLLLLPWPQAFGVLAENVTASGILSPDDRRTFQRWASTILSDTPPARFEQFFLGLRKIAGGEMLKDVLGSSKTYLKWGYFGRDLLVNKASHLPSRTLLSPETRRRLLHELMEGRERITVGDYQLALDYRVSRRQAEIDLSREKRLSPVGNTRGRFYRVTKNHFVKAD